MNPTMNRKKFRALNVSKKFPTQAFDIIDFRIFEKMKALHGVLLKIIGFLYMQTFWTLF